MCFHTCQTRAHKPPPRPSATNQKVVRDKEIERETITPPEYDEAIQDPPVYDDGSALLAAATSHNQTRHPDPAPSYGCGSSCTAEHDCLGKLLERYMAVDVVRTEEEGEEGEEEENEEGDEAEKWHRLYEEAKAKYFEDRERKERRRQQQQ